MHKPQAPIAEPFDDVAVTVRRDPCGAVPAAARRRPRPRREPRRPRRRRWPRPWPTSPARTGSRSRPSRPSSRPPRWAAPSSRDYLNAVVAVRGTLTPHALLGACLAVERAARPGAARSAGAPAPSTSTSSPTATSCSTIPTSSLPHPRAARPGLRARPVGRARPPGVAAGAVARTGRPAPGSPTCSPTCRRTASGPVPTSSWRCPREARPSVRSRRSPPSSRPPSAGSCSTSGRARAAGRRRSPSWRRWRSWSSPSSCWCSAGRCAAPCGASAGLRSTRSPPPGRGALEGRRVRRRGAGRLVRRDGLSSARRRHGRPPRAAAVAAAPRWPRPRWLAGRDCSRSAGVGCRRTTTARRGSARTPTSPSRRNGAAPSGLPERGSGLRPAGGVLRGGDSPHCAAGPRARPPG